MSFAMKDVQIILFQNSHTHVIKDVQVILCYNFRHKTHVFCDERCVNKFILLFQNSHTHVIKDVQVILYYNFRHKTYIFCDERCVNKFILLFQTHTHVIKDAQVILYDNFRHKTYIFCDERCASNFILFQQKQIILCFQLTWRPSVVRRRIFSSETMHLTKLIQALQGWVPFKISSDSPALHLRWILLLKIDISSIVHCWSIIYQMSSFFSVNYMAISNLTFIHS